MTAIAEGFVFGLGSSVHCAAMCGPLVLATAGGKGPLAAYQSSRAAAYVLAGGLLGALGTTGGTVFLRTAAPWAALVLAAGLVLAALGLDRLVGSLPGAPGLVRGTFQRARSWPVPLRAAALGAVTPLLPCGVLWALFGACLLAGGAAAGSLITLGFALGSAPLLVLAQLHGGWLRRWLPRGRERLVTRIVLLAGAGVLAWRGVVAFGGQDCCS